MGEAGKHHIYLLYDMSLSGFAVILEQQNFLSKYLSLLLKCSKSQFWSDDLDHFLWLAPGICLSIPFLSRQYYSNPSSLRIFRIDSRALGEACCYLCVPPKDTEQERATNLYISPVGPFQYWSVEWSFHLTACPHESMLVASDWFWAALICKDIF